MKIIYVYILLVIAIGCKTDKKQILSNKPQTNTLKPVVQSNNTDIYRFIGKSYEDLKKSNEYKIYNYGSVGIDIDVESKTNYSLGILSGKSEVIKYIFFIKTTKNQKIILDVLNLKNEKNDVHTFFCYKNGKNDQEIIAIAKYEEEEFLTNIIKAWRADRKTEKIIEIPVDGITISNESYGL